MQTEQLLCWSGMTDTEHATIFGSNEVVLYNNENLPNMLGLHIYSGIVGSGVTERNWRGRGPRIK